MAIEQELVKQIMMFSTKTEDKNYYTEMALMVIKLAYALNNYEIIETIEDLTKFIKVKCSRKNVVFIDETFDTLNEVEQLYYKYEKLGQVEKSAKVKNVLVELDKQIGLLFIELAKDPKVKDVMIFPTEIGQDKIKPLRVD